MSTHPVSGARRLVHRFHSRRWQPLFLAASLWAAGCTSTQFTPISEQQTWPQSETAMPDTGFAVPVFYGWPNRPYRVIGRIDADKDWNATDLAEIADQAKHAGGEAVIVRTGVGSQALGFAPQSEFTAHESCALVITWVPSRQARENGISLDGFRAYIRRSYPALQLDHKDALWTIAVDYVRWLGLPIESRAGSGRIENSLRELVAPVPDANTSRWLLRGVVMPKGEHSFSATVYGIATVRNEGERIEFSSHVGSCAVHFAGTQSGDHIEGRIGVYSFDTQVFWGQASGTMEADRVTLHSEGHADDLPALADFQLLR